MLIAEFGSPEAHGQKGLFHLARNELEQAMTSLSAAVEALNINEEPGKTFQAALDQINASLEAMQQQRKVRRKNPAKSPNHLNSHQ